MNDLDTILSGLRNLEEDAVLATVVHVSGSAYRQPGARMLLFRNGSRVGSISGGCLEGDLARKAWWWTANSEAVVRVYDTTSEDDGVWEFGLGCNGVIHVLLERIEHARESLEYLEYWRSARITGVIATVIAGVVPTGSRLFLEEEGIVGGQIPGSSLNAAIAGEARKVFVEGTSRLLHHREADVFLERVAPPQRMVVFGAGHDAIPLISIANTLGWRVTVADGRPAYAKAERFPGAEKVVVLPASSDITTLSIDSDTAVVLMTHNFPQDVRLMRQILPLQPKYLGLLGPGRRTERIFDELLEDRRFYDVHAPIGLDIGGDSPESVALAIVAELQAHLHHRRGAMLRYREQGIHVPPLQSGIRSAFDSVNRITLATCESAAL